MNSNKFDPIAAIKGAWDLVKENFLFFTGLVLIQNIITGFNQAISKSKTHPDAAVVFSIFFSIISIFVSIGILKITLNLLDKKKLSYTELWENAKYFWRFLGASILYGLIVTAGLLLFIVPGIYLMIKYQFVSYLIVDKNMTIRDAFKKSGDMTERIKWNLFKFNLLLFGIIILGVLALVVGLLAAIPVTWIAVALVYRKLLK